MDPISIDIPLTRKQLESMTRSELLDLLQAEQRVRGIMQRVLREQKAVIDELEDGMTHIGGVLVRYRHRLFGKSSERSKPAGNETRPRKEREPRAPVTKLPSERYPNAPIVERHMELDQPPACECCGKSMMDSGLTEESEYLQVIPKQYIVVRQLRHKYRCSGCHGSLVTCPGFPRIKAGSSYGNEMIIDIAMSKYCDLIPIERYRQMAARQGLSGLPANSLIEATHHLADLIDPAVAKIKAEARANTVMLADETPHRMLEGSEKSSWYLWGFSSPKACYFECHDTRSGDVASDFILASSCRVLLSDVYSGYAKAVRLANEKRTERNEPEIHTAYCNAHARRKFKEAASHDSALADFFTGQYRKIYRLNKLCANKDENLILEIRKRMSKYFAVMKSEAELRSSEHSSKSTVSRAMNYFLRNYDGLTYFLGTSDVPIDNNAQERLLRSHVVGRKTWYGTHSKRGAETAAKMFTVVESCKLNAVNPRVYLKDLTEALLAGKAALTPAEYAALEKT